MADPFPASELQKGAALEPALRAEVHVLHTRGVPKAGELEEPRQAAIVARPLLALQ